MGKLKHYRQEEIDESKAAKVIIEKLKDFPGSNNKELEERTTSQIARTTYYKIRSLLENSSRIENKKGKYFLYNFSQKKIRAYRKILSELNDLEKEIIENLTCHPKKIDEGYRIINELQDLQVKMTWMNIFIEPEVEYHQKQQLKEIIRKIEDLINYVDFTVGRKYPDLDRIHIQDVKAVLELRKRVSKKIGVPIETVFNPEYFCTRFMSASAYNALK